MAPVGALWAPYMPSHAFPTALTSLPTAASLPSLRSLGGGGSASSSQPAILEYPNLDYQAVLTRVCCFNNLVCPWAWLPTKNAHTSERETVGRVDGLVSWGYGTENGTVSHVDMGHSSFQKMKNSEKY